MPRNRLSKESIFDLDSSETYPGDMLQSYKVLAVFLFHHVDKKEFVSAAAGSTLH